MFPCKYLNFSRSNSPMDLYARQTVAALEGREDACLDPYLDPDTKEYARMVEAIRSAQNFTSLGYHRLDDMTESIGLSPCKLCTYCFNGKE